MGCPAGYGSVEGNIPGGDKFGREFNNPVDSILECKEDCDDREDCGSFHFSPTAMQCFLNEVKTPVNNWLYKDYLLCGKDGYVDPEPVPEEDPEEEEEPIPVDEEREKFTFTYEEHLETWDTVQQHAVRRLELVRQRYDITKDISLTEAEKHEQLDELEAQIREWDEAHHVHHHRYRLMSPAPPPPPPPPREKVHNPDYLAEEDEEDYLMTGRYWGGRYGRKKRSRHSRFRETTEIRPKKKSDKKNSPALEKELDEVLGTVEDLRARTDQCGFTEREKAKMHEELDRYLDDELDRFEEIIEAEEDEDVPDEYEDYSGKLIKVSKEEKKKEIDEAKRRKKRAKDKGKGLKEKQRELSRRVRAREKMDEVRQDRQKADEGDDNADEEGGGQDL